MAVLLIDPDYADFLAQVGLRTFDDFYRYAGGEVVGGHPSRNVTRIDLEGVPAYLKREYRVPWKDRFASWWAGFGWVSKSRREWNVASALHARGIDCPQFLAVGEDGGRAFLLVRELPDMLDLRTYLESDCCHGEAERMELARILGRRLAEFHAAGFSHPDLYAKHVFVHTRDGSIVFIDYQRSRLRTWVSWRQRWRDLASLDASLSSLLVTTRDRLACLTAYLKSVDGVARRRRLHRALAAIVQRSGHLLTRRKIREMRKPVTAVCQVDQYRVLAPQDRLAERMLATPTDR